MSKERKVDPREDEQVEDLELAKGETEGVKGGANLKAADGQPEHLRWTIKNAEVTSYQL